MSKWLLGIVLGLILLVQIPAHAGRDVYVRGYYRNDGTYVQPHYRSAPDGVRWNNYGSLGSWQPDSTPYYQRDSDGDGLLNQYDYDDNNDGYLD